MTAEALRYATLALSGEGLGEVFDLFDSSPAVAMDATRYLGPVENGQYVGLSDLRGDLDVARTLLDESEQVVRYDVAGTDDRGLVYAQYRSVGPVGDLLAILYTDDIVLDWPIEYRHGGGESEARFTVIGTNAGIRQAAADLPAGLAVSLVEIGRFESGDDTTTLLTERQATLLDRALEAGYYEVPRETTQRALADELGVTAGTVSDRLQRIERRVMTAYAGRSER